MEHSCLENSYCAYRPPGSKWGESHPPTVCRASDFDSGRAHFGQPSDARHSRAHAPGSSTAVSSYETSQTLGVGLVSSASWRARKVSAGLQISGSKFQSLNSNFRELELTNFTGLVLGCIEASKQVRSVNPSRERSPPKI